MASPAPSSERSYRQSKVLVGLFALSCIALVGAGLGVGMSSVSTPAEPEREVFAQPDTSILDLTSMTLPVERVRTSGKLRRGSTLQQALIKSGADRSDAHRAMEALYEAELLDPRRLQIGLTVDALLGEETDTGRRLESLTLSPEPGRNLMVKRINEEFLGTALQAKLVPVYQRIAAPIEISLYETALNLGAEDEHIAGFASAFAFDVDFQREIHPGDTFEMVFQSWTDERGKRIKTGEVVYAALDGKAKQKSYYWHTPSDDKISGWYDRAGESATRFLMKTPINGARLSSSFGRRRHPISGYSRLHKGTDFAARTGTPVYAAGNGVVERASRYGGYGKYVRIRHANGYKTAYAHLSRYGRGAKKGRRVRQGDVIGYVGSTGRSTGPHLHYEVLVRGKHVNAMSWKLPTGRKLANAEGMLSEFEAKRFEIDQVRRGLGAEIEVASTVAGTRAK